MQGLGWRRRGRPSHREARDRFRGLQGTHHWSLYRGQRPQTLCSVTRPSASLRNLDLPALPWGIPWGEDASWWERIQPHLRGPREGRPVTSVLIPPAGPETRQDPRSTVQCPSDTAKHRAGEPPIPHSFHG